MRTLKYTFWQDGEFFLGYLNDYPDYHTQAYSKDKLVENLKDLRTELESG
jgi:predicted RNase H-like HicB family nuclease